MSIGLPDEGDVVAFEGIDHTARRRVTPSEELLPRTFRWLARLPREARPMELSRVFPRIANLLAAHWSEPDATHIYLDDLLVDRRGGRRGFPPMVKAELLELQSLYEQLHPPSTVVSDFLGKRQINGDESAMDDSRHDTPP